MPLSTCEISGASIVLLGSFNPWIFQPSWLVATGLAAAQEAGGDDESVIHPQVTAFGIGSLDLRVTREKFEINTADSAQFRPLCDMVIGIFGILEHTPFTAMGLNRRMHFSIADPNGVEQVFARLAPREPWGDQLQDLLPQSLTIAGNPPAEHAGRFSVTVEPSVRVQGGIFFAANEHYDNEKGSAARVLLDLLQARWEESLRFAETFAANLLERTLKRR